MTKYDTVWTSPAASLQASWPARIDVATAARLHVGFLDLNFSLGRRFGSLGIAIEAPATRLSLQAAPRVVVEGREAGRARRYLDRLIEVTGYRGGLHLVVGEAIPSHSGLGSGTQLALAVGAAFSRLTGAGLDSRLIAGLLGRGGRSGVGIGTFDRGGVILDGGRGEDDGPPPVVSRFEFPEAWRLVLVFDDAGTGVHGVDEARAFADIKPMDDAVSAAICRLVLMQALPALVEGDIGPFGQAVSAIQAHVGDHFAPFQGGARFASPRVARVLDWLAANGAAGIGQSSWGPTGYALVGSDAEARRLAAGARARAAGETGLSVLVVRGTNGGASIVSTPVLSAARI